MWQTIWLKWSFRVSKGVLGWLWWLKGLASTWKLGQRCSRNGKLGRPAEYKHVLKKQEDNCPTSMAKGVIVRIVAINVQQSSMDCTVHWQWSIYAPSSRRRWLPLSNKEGYKWWEINRPTFESQRALLVQPLLLTNEHGELSLKPINRHREKELWVRECIQRCEKYWREWVANGSQ